MISITIYTADSSSMTPELQAVITVAGLMALSARTSPKGRGIDEIGIRIVTGTDLKNISAEMSVFGEQNDLGFFIRDGKSVALCDVCVLIGVRGDVTTGINCGGCGYPTCSDLVAAR